MATLKNIYKVTQAQFDALINGEMVGEHSYDPDAIYLVEDDGETNDPNGTVLYLHEVSFTTAEEDENHILRLVSDSSTPFEYDGGNGGIYIGEDKILNAKFGYDGVEYNDCLLTYEYSNDGAIENIAYIERSGTIRSIDITTIVESSLSDTVTEI